MTKVAVVLSGCGVFDGAEIHEAVLTLLALDRAGAEVLCCAPDMPQMHVIDHLRGEVAEGESRNVLVESARIARGEIADLANVHASDVDAVIFPGGFGAAKNLSDFAVRGAEAEGHPEVLRLVSETVSAGKPLGFLCISPAVCATAFRGSGNQVALTVGDDAGTNEALAAMGARPVDRGVAEIEVDEERLIVSSPAYMLPVGIAEVAQGIDKLVAKVLELSREA